MKKIAEYNKDGGTLELFEDTDKNIFLAHGKIRHARCFQIFLAASRRSYWKHVGTIEKSEVKQKILQQTLRLTELQKNGLLILKKLIQVIK